MVLLINIQYNYVACLCGLLLFDLIYIDTHQLLLKQANEKACQFSNAF